MNRLEEVTARVRQEQREQWARADEQLKRGVLLFVLLLLIIGVAQWLRGMP